MKSQGQRTDKKALSLILHCQDKSHRADSLVCSLPLHNSAGSMAGNQCRQTRALSWLVNKELLQFYGPSCGGGQWECLEGKSQVLGASEKVSLGSSSPSMRRSQLRQCEKPSFSGLRWIGPDVMVLPYLGP